MEKRENWLELVWPHVWRKTHRPMAGIVLGADECTQLAARTLQSQFDFLSECPQLDNAIARLQQVAAKESKAWLRGHRDQTQDQDHARDRALTLWAKNPWFTRLRQRSADGALASKEWDSAEPILWQRSVPIWKKLSIRDDDARDVYMETLADFLKPRTEGCPLAMMDLFEELPRLFSTVAERRGISWIRKQTAMKNRPNHRSHAVSIDDEDTGVARTLSSTARSDWSQLNFDEIRDACGDVLSDAEWFLLDAIYVKQSHTRNQMVDDPEMQEWLGIDASASLSTRQRQLNTILADALARLGKAMQDADS